MWLVVREFEGLAKETYIAVVVQNGSHNFSCFKYGDDVSLFANMCRKDVFNRWYVQSFSPCWREDWGVAPSR